jgi:hypothetical protein
MVRITENQTIPIILMLSISILATVLVTGTVINIVSAANSIKVQTKTIQHPVTRTTSPHIASSVARGIANNQSPAKTTQTKLRVGQDTCWGFIPCQCYTAQNGPENPPQLHKYYAVCDATFKDTYVHLLTPDGYTFEVGGKLIGCTGNEVPFYGCAGVWYGIDNAPIEIKVQMGKKAHDWFTPGIIDHTASADATFKYKFTLCDDQGKAYAGTDHDAYVTAYFPGNGEEVKGSRYPGPYYSTNTAPLSTKLTVCK